VLCGDGVHVCRILGGGGLFEQDDGLVHLTSMGVGGAPLVQVGACADQGEYAVGQFGHGDDSA